MKTCSYCGFENVSTSAFCERCGNTLTPSDAAEGSLPTYSYNSQYGQNPQYEYKETANPYDASPYPSAPASNAPPTTYNYGYTKNPVQPVLAQQMLYPQIQQRQRSGAGITLSIISYIWGAGCACFGLAGGIFNKAPSEVIGLIFIVSCIIALAIFIPLLIMRKHPLLRSWVRLLIEIGLGVVALVVLIGWFTVLAAEHVDTSVNGTLIFGVIALLYGVAAAILAFL